MKRKEELVLMIFKTHQHQWLTVKQVKAIINAITGTKSKLPAVQKTINKLIGKGKLIASNDTCICRV